MAKKKLDESPDSIEAHISLASVYVDWATREEVGVDTEALDLAPGETGTRMLTPEIANRAFRGEVRLDLVMAQRATELLEEIVRRWPDHWESHLCLLELHQLGGQREALLAAIRRTARQFEAGGSETVDRLLRFGRYHYERREFAQARDVMQALLEVFPRSAPLLSSLGAVLIESEELEEAMALFRRAHDLAHEDALIVRNLASDAMYLGHLEEAEAALEALRSLEPDQTRVLFELVVVATARNPEHAHAAWTRYLERHAIQPDADDWVAFARSSSDALAKGSDDRSLLAMARALSGTGGSLALALLHGLARRHPSDSSIPFLMAQAYEQERLPRNAYAALQRAEKLLGHPDPLLAIPTKSLRYEAGRVALELDRYADSIRYLEAVEKEAPDTQHLQYLLGLAHGRAGNKDKALRYYQRCLDLPNNAEYARYWQQNLESSGVPAAAPGES